jgi:hypothetical protein
MGDTMTDSSRHLDWDTISALAEGSTTATSQAALHLASCAACRADVAELQAMLQQLHELPPAEVPSDLWHSVRTTITSQPGSPESEVQVLPTVGRRLQAFAFSGRQLAAAALVLMAASSAATVLVMGGSGRSLQVSESPTAPGLQSDARGSLTELELTSTDMQFLGTIEQLERQLVQQHDVLQPETVAIVERSRHIIDEALMEARAALLRDPANSALRTALEGTYRKKVEFLRRATQIASTE